MKKASFNEMHLCYKSITSKASLNKLTIEIWKKLLPVAMDEVSVGTPTQTGVHSDLIR